MDTTHEQFLKIQIDPAFYRSGEHSDITVRYGNGSDTRERMLHKIVLCSQSEFFRLMLAAPMKESHENMVELHEDPDLIDSAIDFIYLGSLTLPDLASPAHVAIRILRTYEIANQYMIGALQDAAATRFSNLIKLNPSLSANVTVLRAAYEDLTRDTHNLQKLISRAYNIWAPAISHEMKSFLLENKDAITDYFFEMARERLELGSCRVCWHCNYQVNVCVTPADPTVENRYDTPVYNAHFLKHCPSCGNPLQPRSLGPVLDD
ncbi:putative btb poz-like protein [Lasiodiplodia theobromae]|nr:putative btb poz-like protein [Lasiodiplodia theobromae]